MKEEEEDNLKLARLKEEVSTISCEARQLSSFLLELKLRNSNNFLIVSWLDRIQLKFIANRNISQMQHNVTVLRAYPLGLLLQLEESRNIIYIKREKNNTVKAFCLLKEVCTTKENKLRLNFWQEP